MNIPLIYIGSVSYGGPADMLLPSTRCTTIPKSRPNESSTSTRRSLPRYPDRQDREERRYNPFQVRVPRDLHSFGNYQVVGFGRRNWLVKTAIMSTPNNRGNTSRAAL
jgi:hypothetical protein